MLLKIIKLENKNQSICYLKLCMVSTYLIPYSYYMTFYQHRKQDKTKLNFIKFLSFRKSRKLSVNFNDNFSYDIKNGKGCF